MASRLLRVCGAWRALRVGPGPLAAGSRAASTGGMPTDEEQATGMERKIMDTIKKGEDPYGVYPPKPYGGTKDDPHLVPSLTNVRLVGCIYVSLPTIGSINASAPMIANVGEEDATETYYFWLHKDKMERCPSCGAHFKLIPCELQ